MAVTPQTADRSNMPACAVLAASLFFSGARTVEAQEGMQPSRAIRQPPSAPAQLASLALPPVGSLPGVDPLFLNESRDLSRHITALPPKLILPGQVHKLSLQGRLHLNPDGTLMDEKSLMLVSWDRRGAVFEKSVFQPPSASHSAAVMVRSRIEAQQNSDQTISFVLHQSFSVISFLPHTTHCIAEHVRLFPSALQDPRGVKGRNWQSLEMLFSPNSFIDAPAIRVSASRFIPVSDSLYRAFVLRAHDLDASGARYFVLGSMNQTPGVENCIGALKGVSRYLPDGGGAEPLPRTFSLRGEDATNYVARDILRRSGITAAPRATFDRPDEVLLNEFVARIPHLASPLVSWYSLRGEN